MPRKAKEKPSKIVDVVDKIFKDVDTEVLLGGLAGAIAARGGITPPLTLLLQTLNSSVKSMTEGNISILSLTGPGFVYTMGSEIADLLNGETHEKTPEQVKLSAIMASGFLEGMIMMEFVKNTELKGQIIDTAKSLGAATIQAVGEAVPL